MARKRKKIKIILRPLGKERAWGLSFNGESRVDLDERCRPKFFLNSCVHEFLHQLDFSLNEATVNRYAKFITDNLWALNFRRIYDENKPMKPKPKLKKKS